MLVRVDIDHLFMGDLEWLGPELDEAKQEILQALETEKFFTNEVRPQIKQWMKKLDDIESKAKELAKIATTNIEKYNMLVSEITKEINQAEEGTSDGMTYCEHDVVNCRCISSGRMKQILEKVK